MPGGASANESDFRSSSFSASDDCVEVAFSGHRVRVRNSRDPRRPALNFSLRQWSAFVSGIRNGDFPDSVKG